MRLENKVALVTGGASGLGTAICERLVAEGAKVVLADRDEDGTARAVEALNAKHPGSARGVVFDVTDPAGWARAVDEVKASHGGALHILVNNAGVGEMGTVEDTSIEVFRRVQAVNVEGPYLGIQACLPLLSATGSASIVNMSSVAGIVAAGNMTAYNTSKAAVRHLTKSIALYCAERSYDVTCNSVHPAFIETPLLKPLEDKYGAGIYGKLAKQIPLQRLGKKEEVAGGVAYLCSEDARFMTGSELVLDGGVSAR